MPTKTKFKLALVTWLDASANEGCRDEDDLKKNEDYILHSAGILVVNNKHHLSLAQDYSVERDDYRRTLHIPRRFVKSVSVVEIKGEKGGKK